MKTEATISEGWDSKRNYGYYLIQCRHPLTGKYIRYSYTFRTPEELEEQKRRGDRRKGNTREEALAKITVARDEINSALEKIRIATREICNSVPIMRVD